MLWWVVAAFAQDPSSSMQDDGSVEVRCTIPASEAEVRAVLSDPVRASELSPETLSVTPTPRGGCTELALKVKGPWDPMALRSLRCPTKSGWKYSLLDSTDLESFEAEWQLRAAPGGTEVVYRVKTDLKGALPRSLVRRGVLASAKETLAALVRQLGRH